MRIILRLAVVALTLASLAGSAAPVLAASCQYVLGFQTLHAMLPGVIGNCVANERYDPASGDGLQPTTGAKGAGGLLVWRKADNWTAFTDGYHTWINGPNGLQERLNTTRFPWEADYGRLYVLTLSDIPSGYVDDPAATGVLTNQALIASAANPSQEQALLQKFGRTGGYQERFVWSGGIDAPRLQLIYSGVNTFSSTAGAQGAWDAEARRASGDWQPVSAPSVGDQSIAFTQPNTLSSGDQNDSTNVPVTDYLIRFRVGRAIGFVQTATPVKNASVNAAVDLAQVMVKRMRATG